MKRSKTLHMQALPALPWGAGQMLLGRKERGPGSLGAPENNLSNLPTISEMQIGDGLAGNIDTIKFMIKVARQRAGNPLIRQLALNILQEYGIPSHHFVEEALAIGSYVQSRVRYVRDPEHIEYLQDPVDLIAKLQDGTAQGDCDDMSLLIATLLLSVGHQPFYRAVRYDSAMGNFNHIYVVVYERDKGGPEMRVVLDAILKDRAIGTEVDHVNGEEYAV